MVQPVFLDYGTNSADIGWVGDEEGLANALKILARAGTFPLRINFLEPFSPVDFPFRAGGTCHTKATAPESRFNELLNFQPAQPLVSSPASYGKLV